MLLIAAWLAVPSFAMAQDRALPGVRVIEVEGKVEHTPPGDPPEWNPSSNQTVLYAGYLFRTGPRSRAVVQLADQSRIPLGPNSLLRVRPSEEPGTLFKLMRGVLYFFRRDDPAEHRISTVTVSCATRGTEYSLEVLEDGTTRINLFDGEAAVSNAFGGLILQSGEAAEGTADAAPARTPFLEAAQALQWRLYYPGVLHLGDLSLDPLDPALSASVKAYGEGDLHGALERYPRGREPASEGESIYYSALVLAVGDVDGAKARLEPLATRQETSGDPPREFFLAHALLKLIAAVKREPYQAPSHGGKREGVDVKTRQWHATEWMAESYHMQAQGDLEGARQAARRATQRAPESGFAWARLAELEFSFGERRAALSSLDTSLERAPRNAQAVVLRGFVKLSRNRVSAALDEFHRARDLDSALANAWFGSGLCRIRMRQVAAGIEDLQTAAALEPQRSLLRSYLGKALNADGRLELAGLELERAREIDPADPTPWLYRALLHRQENRVNEAIDDLERSRALNDNRRVYRSRQLLDQDRAVRGANLAGLYQDAGMFDVSLREAGRALSADYANYSAHLFLANSYNSLRDPYQVSFRFENAWFSEYLMANLLAPVHAGTLSPLVTQNEYSRLFEQDRFGMVSATEYLSRGDWRQTVVQHGRRGNSGYALETSYRSFNGQRQNNDLEDLTLAFSFKHELSPQDSLYFQSIYYDYESGDVQQYYDPDDANPDLRVEENQEPLLLLGYNHEWGPGSHTLFLAARLDDRLDVSNPHQPVLSLINAPAAGLVNVPIVTNAVSAYENDYEAYTFEWQQVWTHADTHAVVVGARYLTGTLDTDSELGPYIVPMPPPFILNVGTAPLSQRTRVDVERVSAYAYDYWRLADSVQLTAGVAFDYMEYPENHRYIPLSMEDETKSQWSPKAGLIWTPLEGTAFRGSYTRSLGGVSFEQSVRLEPTQVAGFNQAYRSIIPESVTGGNVAEEFETAQLAWDQEFPSRTYLGVQGEWLRSDADRRVGAMDITPVPLPSVVEGSSTRETLDYDERSLLLTVNQLVGNHWSLGSRYRLSHAGLDQHFTEIPGQAEQELEATLHQVWLYAVFHHECGFFSQADTLWSQQSNQGYATDIPGDDFWQFNLHAGYRFWQRRAELRVSLLNLADQDYNLNPLNLTPELPRERTVALSARFSF